LADGIPLRELDVREWRGRLSNVSQEFLRLEAPLRTNLAIGNLDGETEDDLLWAACDQAGLREAALALPHKLDQRLGRRFAGGVELSGGEWQKVAIARALLRREAGVIILDEPPLPSTRRRSTRSSSNSCNSLSTGQRSWSRTVSRRYTWPSALSCWKTVRFSRKGRTPTSWRGWQVCRVVRAAGGAVSVSG